MEKTRGRSDLQRKLNRRSALADYFFSASSHSATPPCLEQAPVWLFACEYVPSLHFATAPVGSVFFAFVLASDAA